MANCNVKMDGCDPKVIATELRKTAAGFDPWGGVRASAFWFALGGLTVAAMDYGDVWICVGQCNAATSQSR